MVWQRKCSRTKSPRSVGDVWIGLPVCARNVPWPRMPLRVESAGYSVLPKVTLGSDMP